MFLQKLLSNLFNSMKNQVALLLLLFCTFFTASLFAQNKGTGVFFIKPYNAFLKIDNQVFDLSKENFPLEVSLEEGKYVVELWAPTFAVQKISFEIKSNKATRIVKELTELNLKIQDRVSDNSFKKVAINGGLVAMDLGLTVVYFVSKNKTEKALNILSEELDELRSPHQNLLFLSDLEASRAMFESQKSVFDEKRKKHNNKVVIGGVGLGVLYGLTTFLFVKQLKNKQSRAVKKDRNPFGNLSLDFNTGVQPNTSYTSNDLVLRWTF